MHLTIPHVFQLRYRLHLPARLRTQRASLRLQIFPPIAMIPTLVLVIGQRRGHPTRHGIESKFVEADLIVTVVC